MHLGTQLDNPLLQRQELTPVLERDVGLSEQFQWFLDW